MKKLREQIKELTATMKDFGKLLDELTSDAGKLLLLVMAVISVIQAIKDAL